MLRKAYSTFEIKSADEEQRVLTGIASTLATDMAKDIVEPLGCVGQYTLPLPVLYQHNSEEPVGHVTRAQPNAYSIPVTISMATTDRPGPVRELLDKAWENVRLKLVRGLSLGFIPKEWSYIEGGGIHYKSWSWHELSLVTIPCNQDASITNIKRFDVGASRHLPVVRLSAASGFRRDQHMKPTLTPEQMAALKGKAEGYTQRLYEALRPLDREPDHIALGVLEAAQQILSARIATRKR